MKNNKIVAWGIIGSLITAILTSVFSDSLMPSTVNSLYTLAGLGYMVFGIWAAVILFKN